MWRLFIGSPGSRGEASLRQRPTHRLNLDGVDGRFEVNARSETALNLKQQ